MQKNIYLFNVALFLIHDTNDPLACMGCLFRSLTLTLFFFLCVVMIVALCERSLFSFLYFMYNYIISK